MKRPEISVSMPLTGTKFVFQDHGNGNVSCEEERLLDALKLALTDPPSLIIEDRALWWEFFSAALYPFTGIQDATEI